MDGFTKGILLSLLPISELRGGIPVAVASGVGWFPALIICVAANVLVIIPVFFFLDHVHSYLMRIKIYETFFTMYLDRVRKRVESQLAKNTWEYWVLFLFVAIPFPSTGAYTGCLVAWLLEMDRKKSFITIALGVLVAGIVVTSVVSIASLGFLKFIAVKGT
ncbi:MAG: small multi-drug export protein [Deltaproteobacteria bacterium]|nr:small multi-drug export protein [Pseudomonadota bacterium]MCK5186527.1 small multi-drug export protein [Deltaproteobacteria bacterium]